MRNVVVAMFNLVTHPTDKHKHTVTGSSLRNHYEKQITEISGIPHILVALNETLPLYRHCILKFFYLFWNSHLSSMYVMDIIRLIIMFGFGNE